jgi:tripartite-type tricarboxylate transporter receptor subunit TctC
MSAQPDGLTIGLLNASRRIVDRMISDGEQPDIMEDFTLLARYARSQHVLLTGNESKITGIDTLFDMQPLPVFGTKNYRSSGLMATVLLADLLQFKFDVVAGLGGTRKRVLAASRRDVDIISSNYFSVNSDIEAGTIRPLLQASTSEISDHPNLKNVPVLGGADGVAARRAAELGIDVEKSIERALAIETLVSAGRVLVAPAGLSDRLTSCLQDAVLAALQSAEFASDINKANMKIDVASGSATAQELKNSQSEFEQLIPLLKQTIGNK